MSDTHIPTASVSVDIAAEPALVYSLVADLPSMGRWSPECVKCTWIGGASRAAPGARFKGYNRRGVRRWTTKGEVVVADPGRELTFDVSSLFGLPVARWCYEIEPHDGGCTVTESTEDRRGRLITFLGTLATGVRNRATHNTAGMHATLERLKQEAEGAA